MKRIVWRVIGLASMVLGVALVASGVSTFAFDFPRLSMWLLVLGTALVIATFKWFSGLLMIAAVVALAMVPFSWSGGSWGTWLLLSLSFGVLGLIGIVTADWGDTSASAGSEAEMRSPTTASLYNAAQSTSAPSLGAVAERSDHATSSTAKFCSACGQARRADEKFCTACGSSLRNGT